MAGADTYTDLQVISQNSAIMHDALNRFNQLEQSAQDTSTDFYNNNLKYNNVITNVEYWAQQALDHGGLTDNDKWRITNKIYTKSASEDVSIYSQDSVLYNIMQNYTKWVGQLGSTPPQFGNPVSDTADTDYIHLRRGARTDVTDSMNGFLFYSKEYDALKETVKECINSASDYITILENELVAVNAIDAAQFLAPYRPLDNPNDFPNEFFYTSQVEMQAELIAKQAVQKSIADDLAKEIRYWKRVKKYVSVENLPDQNTFDFVGLEFVSLPLSPINWEVHYIWFDSKNRDYVIDLVFDGIPNLEEVYWVGNYKLDQGILINTVTMDGYTEDQAMGMPISDINYKHVILRSKFAILPNQLYELTLQLSNMSVDFFRFNRQVYPIPSQVDYFADNEIHVQFKPNIDLADEGIASFAVIKLDELEVKNLNNFQVVDINGNSLGVWYTHLESDLQTIAIKLSTSMVDRGGYNVVFSNLYYETGGMLMAGQNIITFVYSDPYPVKGLVGVYDKSLNIIALGWLPSSQSTVVGYNVYRKQSVGGNSKFFKLNKDAVVDEKFVDFTAENNKSYNYVVSAVDMNGNESIASNVLTIVKV